MAENNLYLSLAEKIVRQADLDTETAARIVAGVRAEYAPASPDADASPADDTATLCRSAKSVRLAGVWPYYTAQLIALYLHGQPDFLPSGVMADYKAYVQTRTGFVYEVELVQMIAEACLALAGGQYALIPPEKAAVMGEAYAKGYHYEKDFRGCAQCTFAAVGDLTGREDPALFRAANGFAAGMALMGDGVCGGYSGGLLSIGLFAGRRRECFDGDKAEKDLNAKMAGALHKRFMDTYGSVICHGIHRDIFGRCFHLTQAEDKVAFEDAGAHSADKCPAVVGTAAAWVAEILMDEKFL